MTTTTDLTAELPVRTRARLPRAGYAPGARTSSTKDPDVPLCRLASNEMALGPLPEVMEMLRSEEAVHRYPDPTAAVLRRAIADHVGVEVDQVATGAGSVALVDLLLRLVAGDGDEVVVGAPSFGAYSTLADTAGTRAVGVPLRGTSMDLDAMAGAMTERTRAVFVCTPNNPTGGCVSAAEVRSFVESVPADTLVVLDEAYREFVVSSDPVDGVDLLGAHPNLVTLRTFSKAYGLAGLRVGYAVADPSVVRALTALQAPFSVNAPAQAAALAALATHEQTMARVADVVQERERVIELLRSAGVDAPDSQGNFVWLPLGERTAAVHSALERAGVLTRPFAGQGIRATIGTPAEDDQLVAALVARS